MIFVLRGNRFFEFSRLLNMEHEISSSHKLKYKVEMRLKD